MTTVERTRIEEVALGMTLLGLVASSVLYGVTILQTFSYYKKFPNDHIMVRILVAAVCLLDTASVCLVTHAAWYYLVIGGRLNISVWSLNAELSLSMVISGISETFLAYRVFKVSNRRYTLATGIMLLALLHFASGEASAIQFFILKRFSLFGFDKAPSILRLSSAALCDTGIALSLCYFLHQRRTGYKRTDKIIDKLIAYSINTGLLMSISSIICLATYLTIPKTWVYIALCFLISRLYANTFLSTLNSRRLLLPVDPKTAADGRTNSVPHIHSRRSGRRAPLLKRHSEKVNTAIMKPTGSLSHMSMATVQPPQIDVYVVTETITDNNDSHVLSGKASPALEGVASQSSLGSSEV